MNIILGYLIIAILELCIVPVTEILSKRNIHSEVVRKISHISAFVIMWVFSYIFFKDNSIHAVIAATLYAIVATILQYAGLVKTQRDNGNNNYKSTFLEGISMMILSLAAHLNNELWLAYGLGMFAVAFGDTAAALVGVKYGKNTPKCIGAPNKSVIGAIAFIVAATITMYIPALMIGVHVALWKMVTLATVGSLVEIYSGDYDNLLIPVMTFVSSIVLL